MKLSYPVWRAIFRIFYSAFGKAIVQLPRRVSCLLFFLITVLWLRNLDAFESFRYQWAENRGIGIAASGNKIGISFLSDLAKLESSDQSIGFFHGRTLQSSWWSRPRGENFLPITIITEIQSYSGSGAFDFERDSTFDILIHKYQISYYRAWLISSKGRRVSPREYVIELPSWLAALATGLIPTLSAIVRIRHRFRSKQRIGHCAKCGYDLRASPDRCPECGTDVPKTTLGTPANK